MGSEKMSSDQIAKSLNEIKKLLQQSVVIQLYKTGATQSEIAKNQKIAVGTVNQMLKGVKKRNE